MKKLLKRWKSFKHELNKLTEKLLENFLINEKSKNSVNDYLKKEKQLNVNE